MDPLSDEEIRVLGSLAEKEATVPDVYPMTLNSLRQACNQSSNRDPVVAYDDLTIQRCLDALKGAGYVRFVHPVQGERATKFRHVLGERLALDAAELALLTVLALRGPQTSGELRTRTERHHPFAGTVEVEVVLGAMAAREDPLAVELPRLPGQHQTRWMHLLAGPVDVELLAVVHGAGGARSAPGSGGVGDRVAALEAEVAGLRERLARLEVALGIAPDPAPDADDDTAIRQGGLDDAD